MNIKPRPNHSVYLRILRGMTSEQRLAKALGLSEFARELFRQGLRDRFPNLNEAQLHELCLKRLEKCHNRKY